MSTVNVQDAKKSFQSARSKRHQLELEIRKNVTNDAALASMLHSLSKLWMFATECIEPEIQK